VEKQQNSVSMQAAVSNQDEARMYGEAGKKEQEVETSSIVA
jgi:hypothetical protein